MSIDWTLRERARARIRVMVKRSLNKYGYPPDLQEEAVKKVPQQAELLCAGRGRSTASLEVIINDVPHRRGPKHHRRRLWQPECRADLGFAAGQR